jgi:thioesterase domain-containing protein
MSKEQMAELQLEISQQVGSDERMLLEYEIRFWKQKAWRAEQQRDRAQAAQKDAEDIAEKYKSIPQEILDSVALDLKEKELQFLRETASSHIPTIGLKNFRILNSKADMLDSMDAKIKHWKHVVNNHSAYKMNEDDD